MRKVITVLILCAVIIVGILPVYSTQTQVEIMASDDLYIDQNDKSSNFAEEKGLLFQNVGSSKYNREIWVRFNVEEMQIPKGYTIGKAIVSLYIANNYSSGEALAGKQLPLSLYSLSDTSYNAEEITYELATRPVKNTKLATSYLAPYQSFKAGFVDFDVTNYLKLNKNEAKVAFAMYPGTNGVKGAAYSMEMGTEYAPRLTVELARDFEQFYTIYPEEEVFSGGKLFFKYNLKQYGDEQPNSNSYAVDVTSYVADSYVGGKSLNFCVKDVDSAYEKPYLQIEFNEGRTVIESAKLYFDSKKEEMSLYQVTEDWDSQSISSGTLPTLGQAVPLGGDSVPLDITVGGYTQSQLETTYYMAKDDDKAFADIEEVFDISKVPVAAKIEPMLDGLKHPYLIGTDEDFSRVRTLMQTDGRMRGWIEDIKASADEFLAVGPSDYLVSGGSLATNVYNAVTKLAFMYQVSQDEVYAEKCIEYLEKAASYPDWNPQKLLNIGEMGTSVALAYDWMYNYMGDTQRNTIRTALEEKVLNFMDGNPCLNTNNWNPVVNGGTLIAALAVGKDNPSLSARLIYQSVCILPKALRCFSPDGGFPEASGYYTYLTDYMVMALASIDTALHTDFGLSDIEGISKCGYFPIATRGFTNEQALSYGDGEFTARYTHSLYWLSNKFNNPDFGLYQLSLNVEENEFSALWYRPEMYNNAVSSLPRNFDYISHGPIPYATMRANGEIFAGLKGGFNQSSHGDLDIGTFTLGAFGKQWTKEMEGVKYNTSEAAQYPPYFRMSRYTFYCKQPQGHNTLVIGQPSNHPKMTFGQSLTAHCDFTESYSGEEESYAVLDMTEAYSENAKSAIRGMKVNKKENYVQLRDEINVGEKNDIWWFMHTDAEIQTYGKKAVLTLGDKQLVAQILSDEGEFEVMKAEPLYGTPSVKAFDLIAHSNVKKLAIRLENVKEAVIDVVFMAPENDAEVSSMPIDTWKYQFTNEPTEISKVNKVIIPVAEDTFINESEPDRIYGAENYLDIKYTASSKYNREGYIKFKTENIPENVNKVTLNMFATRNYCTPYAEETMTLYDTYAGWSEQTLCWNNKTGFGSQVGTMTIPSNGENSAVDTYVSADVTEYILNSLQNEEVSLGMKMSSRRNANAVFSTKEDGENSPYLLAEYTIDKINVIIRNDKSKPRNIAVLNCHKEGNKLIDVSMQPLTVDSGKTAQIYIDCDYDKSTLYVWDIDNLEPIGYSVSYQ